jgi:low affinity Fe/Cu permease
MNWMDTGRFLIIAGTVIVVLGLVFLMADKIPIGRLPGDLKFGGDRFRIYIPVATCVLLSVVITLIVNFFSRK